MLKYWMKEQGWNINVAALDYNFPAFLETKKAKIQSTNVELNNKKYLFHSSSTE